MAGFGKVAISPVTANLITGRIRGSEQRLVRVPPPELAKMAARRNDPCPCGSGKKFKRCHGV